MKQTYIQFTAGRGPVECAAACYKVVKKFFNELEELKLKARIVDCEEDDVYGYRSVVIQLIDTNESIINNLKSKWEGSIQFISTHNSFRPNHKRKNWFIGCNFFDIDDSKIELNMNDVKIYSMRSSGPGGQNVNKVESGVQLTHIPTGIIVKCTATRDQKQNLKIAKEILQSKINSLNDAQVSKNKNMFWMNHDSLERGNPVMVIKGEI